jgi:predicted alpha-1,6-mannanase (GH76 family)
MTRHHRKQIKNIGSIGMLQQIAAVQLLIHLFWNADEHYFNYNNLGLKDFHYWPQAHALDVMVDAYLRTRDNLYKTTINDWYDGVKRKNGNTFFNIFYDDMEWNALAMLRAYQATGR